MALVNEGLSCHEVARRLRISAVSVVRIMQCKKRTGGVKVVPQGRPRRSKLDAVSDWLRALVEAEPDITMPELAEALKVAHDLVATPAMLSRHLIHRLGFTHKKSLIATEREWCSRLAEKTSRNGLVLPIVETSLSTIGGRNCKEIDVPAAVDLHI